MAKKTSWGEAGRFYVLQSHLLLSVPGDNKSKAKTQTKSSWKSDSEEPLLKSLSCPLKLLPSTTDLSKLRQSRRAPREWKSSTESSQQCERLSFGGSKVLRMAKQQYTSKWVSFQGPKAPYVYMYIPPCWEHPIA